MAKEEHHNYGCHLILSRRVTFLIFHPSVVRCVLNWFGDWSNGALYHVGKEFTNKIDLDRPNVSCLAVYRF